MVKKVMEAYLPLCESSLVENYGDIASSTVLNALVDSFFFASLDEKYGGTTASSATFFSCVFYALTKEDPLEEFIAGTTCVSFECSSSITHLPLVSFLVVQLVLAFLLVVSWWCFLFCLLLSSKDIWLLIVVSALLKLVLM